ncbi:hypothetical protein OG535_27615 [Kitasatospora sp. NBC_00085]|uniref:hypothetical protein n=1 Tax=unclassified Kitasatospora TaxID=2633591 RepID=UPI00324F15AA
MRSGTAGFLVGAALITLLALALVTVALGVIATIKMPHPDAEAPPPPISRHGRWELRRLPDGTYEYAWIARQAGHFGPEIPQPSTKSGRHRIPD